MFYFALFWRGSQWKCAEYWSQWERESHESDPVHMDLFIIKKASYIWTARSCCCFLLFISASPFQVFLSISIPCEGNGVSVCCMWTDCAPGYSITDLIWTCEQEKTLKCVITPAISSQSQSPPVFFFYLFPVNPCYFQRLFVSVSMCWWGVSVCV